MGKLVLTWLWNACRGPSGRQWPDLHWVMHNANTTTTAKNDRPCGCSTVFVSALQWKDSQLQYSRFIGTTTALCLYRFVLSRVIGPSRSTRLSLSPHNALNHPYSPTNPWKLSIGSAFQLQLIRRRRGYIGRQGGLEVPIDVLPDKFCQRLDLFLILPPRLHAVLVHSLADLRRGQGIHSMFFLVKL